ncbi:c-type cytochrome [Psychromarinibacter halotolerans]|uniref:C-type cytochrome n=1 Tax=Psychromarinibacter halotolerans TaxID=1775175 RepID=A0ABV7GJU9_9RHOB|nr:c-type cytochrome [Psychromarinibacter halotolerans]MAQ83377.1 3-methyladenine DNA glycosylase [Maritimibacter sp.]MDF0595685.1 c-type cytochrome [Psychromarinibacter halotolerans]
MRHTILVVSLTVLSTFGGAQAQDAGVGGALFAQYCATCHGTDAMGDGPLNDLMTTKAPDLTGLSARNDGSYPMLEVIHIIDGRTGLRGHGGPMPTYGSVFDDEHGQSGSGDYSAILETRGRILSLAMFLESIQQ